MVALLNRRSGIRLQRTPLSSAVRQALLRRGEGKCFQICSALPERSGESVADLAKSQYIDTQPCACLADGAAHRI